jgi:hypothetical protein
MINELEQWINSTYLPWLNYFSNPPSRHSVPDPFHGVVFSARKVERLMKAVNEATARQRPTFKLENDTYVTIYAILLVQHLVAKFQAQMQGKGLVT